ncbi:MAG: DUF3367 domain-containing protein, partial [Thermoleophilaceae bacterium]|nr:DUF3367 domain-containing protein [Thermoleophilaceae bacterium]
MARPTRDRTMAIVLAGLSFVLAFVQRPGWASSDTKIDLHVDPQAFVGQVASVWSPSIDFGAVQSAQYGGYLWPMAPFYALLHALGLGPWVTHRLWLGVLFALSAWGILRLFDALIGRPRGVAHLVGAVFYVLNPYTVIFTGRTSVVFLGYAALPWLLLIVHHGIRNVGGWREWRGWWFAAGFALILTSIGGGINGAVVGWMLVGPLVLLIYEPLVRLVRWRDSVTFLVRVGILGTLASLWWIVPLTVHARYGIDFLQFTEQPRTIWSTNSVPEALRLMAYWTSYIGVGFFGANRPLFSEAGTLLFNPAVVFASLLLPAMAILGFAWTRRFRYAPFFLLILLAGMVIETAGFPDGTPSRDAMEWLYRNLPLVRFMRTTQKAAPLVAIGGAGLLGLAAQLAWARLRALGPGRLRSAALIGAPAALAALIALAALPLVRGTAPERQIVWKEIPRAWTQAGADLDRELRPNSRALVLPGQIFANYMWAGTTDAIFPRVTDKPVAVRYETPYSDPHAFDLLATIDGAVQQRRLLPGQLEPLLRLSGTGAVITGSDDDISRSGAVDPVAAAEELAGQGLGRPARSYPPVRRLPPARGDVGPALPLPEVRRYDIPPGRGIVGVEPAGPATVVDGSAAGLAGLAAFGALPERRPILYAGDLTQGQLRSTVRDGAEVVVTDSNRRRRFLPEFSQQSLGPTLTEGQQFDENNAVVEPFPDRGTDAQTVAVLRGAKALSAPDEGGLLLFPEHAPFAAFDGDRETMWAADRYLKPDKRWIQVDFNRPRDVPWIELEPVGDVFGIEREVEVGGVRARIRPGVNRIRLGLRDVSALRVTITDVDQPSGNLRGSGGFREIRIPGLHVRQLLRTPVLSARALAGQDLSRTTLTYLFERTTGDQPFLRDRQTGSPLLELARDRSDAEQEIDRTIFAPERRSYALEAWVHPAVDASDSALDELAGLDGDARFESSGRFHNQPRFRASSAFDGRAGSAWMGIWARPSAPFPWISWRTAEPQAVSRLRLVPARGGVRRPTRVRVSFPGGATPVLAVGADGAVRLPRPVRSRSFRLTVMDARLPEGVGRDRATRAVGIASLEVPGLAPATPRTTGRIVAPCGAVRVDAGGRTASLRPHGTVEALDAGL